MNVELYALHFELGDASQSCTHVVNLSRDRRCYCFGLPVPLGNGNLGRRVAPLSVHPILSVWVCV